MLDADLGKSDTVARAKEKRVLEGIAENSEPKFDYMSPGAQKEMREKLENLAKSK